ncbi:hypothetical protein, partial [Listeria monocytogenes]|uniref:hypothetical protein n=1 Tax=Listeria monocytogenes TaxID=1639 RepID=UPI0024991154
HHQNTLGSFASTISPFLMMTNPEIKRIYVVYDICLVFYFISVHFGFLMLPKGERKMGIFRNQDIKLFPEF